MVNALASFSPIARGVIVAPMLLAVFIAIVATPPLRWLRRKRVPKWLALAVIIFLLIEAPSLATALSIWVWLWFLGIDFAVLLGLLAFLPNFIPFVGALLMTIPAVLLALVLTNLQTTLLVVLGYLVANTVIGSILEPRIMGRGLGISTLAVLLSLLFWGWVLGTVGVFLSVPLTIALMIALEASPQTRPMAILLGPELVARPEPDHTRDSVAGTADQEPGSP